MRSHQQPVMIMMTNDGDGFATDQKKSQIYNKSRIIDSVKHFSPLSLYVNPTEIFQKFLSFTTFSTSWFLLNSCSVWI